MKWRIQCKQSGQGHDFEGTFDDAVRKAQEQCPRPWSRWLVCAQPGAVRLAEVGPNGCLWVKTKLTGEEVVALMRRSKKTIGGLAFILGVAQQRVRQMRRQGVENPHAVRDWLEAITGEDPGPLPERYRIEHHTEEADCDHCGGPLYVGESAYEFAGAVYCSVTCCRQSRGYRASSAA